MVLGVPSVMVAKGCHECVHRFPHFLTSQPQTESKKLRWNSRLRALQHPFLWACHLYFTFQIFQNTRPEPPAEDQMSKCMRLQGGHFIFIPQRNIKMISNSLTLQLNTNLEKQFWFCKSSLCVFRRLNSSGSFIPKVYQGGCLKCLSGFFWSGSLSFLNDILSIVFLKTHRDLHISFFPKFSFLERIFSIIFITSSIIFRSSKGILTIELQLESRKPFPTLALCAQPGW